MASIILCEFTSCRLNVQRGLQAATRSNRYFTTSLERREELQSQEPKSTRPPLDPNLVATPKLERRLINETRKYPVGSRRRRALMRQARQIPFEQLPYQCFQEARKILAEDRDEKLAQIESTRRKLQMIKDQEVEEQNAGFKERRVISLEQHLEELKVLADINDPLVKRNFQDGIGDMSKPVYRHLAEKKWESLERKIAVQRIEQFKIVPDILQALNPEVQVDISFGRRRVDAGEFIESYISERAPTLKIQSFVRDPRLVTIACINPDIPDVANDAFRFRCHFLAHNISITPTEPFVHLGKLASDQLVLPWYPAYNQKGAPYHRMAFVILQQPNGVKIDVELSKRKAKRDGMTLRAVQERYRLASIGATLFRSKWDEQTAALMKRLGVPGHDVEFKRIKVEPLPYKKLPGSRYR